MAPRGGLLPHWTSAPPSLSPSPRLLSRAESSSDLQLLGSLVSSIWPFLGDYGDDKYVDDNPAKICSFEGGVTNLFF